MYGLNQGELVKTLDLPARVSNKRTMGRGTDEMGFKKLPDQTTCMVGSITTSERRRLVVY